MLTLFLSKILFRRGAYLVLYMDLDLYIALNLDLYIVLNLDFDLFR